MFKFKKKNDADDNCKVIPSKESTEMFILSVVKVTDTFSLLDERFEALAAHIQNVIEECSEMDEEIDAKLKDMKRRI